MRYHGAVNRQEVTATTTYWLSYLVPGNRYVGGADYIRRTRSPSALGQLTPADLPTNVRRAR